MSRLRRLAAAAAALLLAGTTAGCAGGAAGTRNTVTMWAYPVIFDPAKNARYWNGLVTAFEKRHPDITVHVETYPWANRDTALATAVAAGKAPDVVYLVPDQLPLYADNLVPADRYMPSSDRRDYTRFALRSVTAGGKVLATPVLTSANPLICDKRVFRAIGEAGNYPSTWAELTALAPKLKAKGYYATSYSGDTQQTLNLTFYPLLRQAGGEVYGRDGSPAFDSPAGLRALSWLRKLVADGLTSRDLVTTTPKLEQTPVARGKVACTWQNTPADVEPFWGRKNIAVLPPLKDARSTGYGTVGALGMIKGADTSAAGKWISFVAQPRNAAGLERRSGNFPARRSAPDLYPDDPLQSAVAETLPAMDAGPLRPKARQLMAVLAPEIQAALLGRKSPAAALHSAARAAAALR